MSLNQIKLRKTPILKDPLIYKLKDINKSKKKNINKTSLLFHIKKDINTRKKEKEYKLLIKNYSDLKHEIYLKDKEEEKRLREKDEEKELGYFFKKFNNKLNQFKRNFHKKGNVNLNLSKNGIVTKSKNNYNIRVNSVLYKIWSRFNEGFNGDKDYKKFINAIDNLTEKNKSFSNNINNRKKIFNLKFVENNNKNNSNNNLFIYRNIFLKNIIRKNGLNSASIINKKKYIQNNENISSININGKLTSSTVINNMKNKKEIFENISTNISNKNKHSLLRIKKINKMHINSSTSKFNKNKIIYRNNTPKKKNVHSVINSPIFTIKIIYIINRYNKIKTESKQKKKKYIENNILTYDKIDSIIGTKEDLLMFLLKRKFLENKFPSKKYKKIEINKKETFIKKMKYDIEILDKPFDAK